MTGAGNSNIGYSTSSNRLESTTGANPQSYGYDALGNLTTLGGTTAYQYDAFNRMSTAGGMSYYVNPEGRRLRKAGSLGATYFAPDASGTLLAENADGAWIDYVWLGGRLIGRAVNGQLEAIHADQLGRPQMVTNAAQVVVWSAQNLPFTRNVTVSSSAPLNIGFPGQYYDQETGLWNNGFRDYDSTLGRYVESDPLGLNGGINTYAYVDGNPLTNIDPFGLTKWTVGIFYIGGPVGYVRFQATSECVNGKRTMAEGNVFLWSLGVGGGFSGSTVTVDDGIPGNLDPSVFNGLYVAQGANVTFGFGLSYGGVRFGQAATDGHDWGKQGGLSEGASSDFGWSHVTGSSTFNLY